MKISSFKTFILMGFLFSAGLGCSSDTFSVIVAGHLYPIHQGMVGDNLQVFSKQINAIENGKGLFLLGDSVFNSQKKDYLFLEEHF